MSQDCHLSTSILREKLGSNHTVKFSKGTWHCIKIRERKGPSRGVIQKCGPHERNPCAPELRKEHKTKPCNKSTRPQSGKGLGEKCVQAQKTDKASFYSPVEARAMPAPISKNPEARGFVVDSGAGECKPPGLAQNDPRETQTGTVCGPRP